MSFTRDDMLALMRQRDASPTTREAIKRRRHLNLEGPKRDAFEAYRQWLVKEMEPAFSRLCNRKLKEVAQEHGVTEGELLTMLARPPAGESRTALLDYVYELVMG